MSVSISAASAVGRGLGGALSVEMAQCHDEKAAEIFARVYSEDSYQRYLGAQTELVPEIPAAISLKRFNDADPCNPASTIGQNYFWVYSPSYFTVIADQDFRFQLDGPDNDDQAPRLIEKRDGLIKEFQRVLGWKSNPKMLKVANTLNNLGVLFKHPKSGVSSSFQQNWESVTSEHGNTRISPGWHCMREEVIGRDRPFDWQWSDAEEAGVKISRLGHRILLNFLRHAETGVYPDGLTPQMTYARTSTLTGGLTQRYLTPSICGAGGPSGLALDYGGSDGSEAIGVGVELPTEAWGAY